MTKSKKIFVFALDGATWKLLDRWIEKGHLPFLAKLVNQGIKRDLISTIPPRTAPAWASFISGLTPAEHGIYDFLVTRDVFGNREEEMVNGGWLGKNKFWKKWEREGKKIGLINLPLGYPVEKVNGVLISSFLTPEGAQFAYPSKMIDRLERLGLGRDKIGLLDQYMEKKTNREIFELVKAQLDQRFRGAKQLIEEMNFDFFFFYCRETDIVQHLFWRGRQTLELYRRLDRLLGDFYEFLGKKYGKRNFYFLLMSDHGFHPSPKIQVNLYPWLRKQGLLKTSLKASLARVFRKLAIWERDKSNSRFNRWGESPLLRVGIFGIWLNRKLLGRRYQQYRHELIEALRQLKFGNRRVFQLVAPREEIYPRGRKKWLWDIIWLTRPYFVIGPCSIERKVFISASNPIRDRLLGWHDSDRRGIFLIKGVGARRLLRPWQNKEIFIWDLPQIFDLIMGYRKRKSIKLSRTARSKRLKLSDKERGILAQRLKNLGYL